MDITLRECKRRLPINSSDRRCDEREEVDCDEGDKLKDMRHDVDEYFVDYPHFFWMWLVIRATFRF